MHGWLKHGHRCCAHAGDPGRVLPPPMRCGGVVMCKGCADEAMDIHLREPETVVPWMYAFDILADRMPQVEVSFQNGECRITGDLSWLSPEDAERLSDLGWKQDNQGLYREL